MSTFICLVQNPQSKAIAPIVDENDNVEQWTSLQDARINLENQPLVKAWMYWLIDLDEVDSEMV